MIRIFCCIALFGFLSFTLSAQETPYDCTGLDTLETWQGVRYCVVYSSPEGRVPVKGDKVYVRYTGYFEDGTVFDASAPDRPPFGFRLQKMEVIRGWDIVFERLKAGDKARVFIPWKYAYGKHGNPPRIPRKANLIFDVELVKVVH